MNPRSDWYRGLGLSEQQAIDAHLAASNRLPWRVALGLSTVVSAVSMLFHASENSWLRVAVWFVLLLGIFGIYLARRRPAFVLHARTVLLAHFAALLLAITLTVVDPLAGFVIAAIVFPASLLFFRFTGAETVVVAALTAGIAGWFVTRMAATTAEEWLPMAIVGPLWICGTSFASHWLSKRSRRRFLDDWRAQVRLAREHRRMRGELDDARTLQLAMLPSSLPTLPWLDISAICIPASEVGGDYYDALTLDDGRLAVVVADVAGHGMSSGMVLASMRGGLYVLRDELDDPVRAITRLGRMLQSVSGRMFVTFQLAIVDPAAGEINVISAGHPPLIVADAGGTSTFLGHPAPPLGTGLPASPTEDRRNLSPGDILVMYSDGLIETVDHHGDALGFERLAEHIERLASDAEARQIRDGLLSRVASYKGDGEQADDMTIVVLKYLG